MNIFLQCLVTGPLLNNTIIIGCLETKKAAVVDPAFGSHKQISDILQIQHFKLDKILLTHSHWDHFGDAGRLKNLFKAPVYVHEKDKQNLTEPGSDSIPMFLEVQPVVPDHYVEENEMIQVGNIEIKVIYTPGHSLGSVCYYIEKENLLFSGDTLFKGSMGKVSFETSDPEKMFESLKKLSQLPSYTRVIPGHGKETTIGQESWMKEARKFFL